MSRWVVLAVAVAAISVGTPVFAQSDLLKELEASCEAGDGFACKRWGVHLNLGFDRPAEPIKARSAYEKGCKLKDSRACANLATMLAHGEGGPRDIARARQLAKAGCNDENIAVQGEVRGAGLCDK